MPARKTLRRLAAWLVLGVLLSVQAQASQPPEVGASLRSLVSDYFFTPDADKAQQLLTEILNREDATIPAITVILKEERTYETVPRGMLPGQAVVVDSHSFRYGLYIPATYAPDKAYPLVICLHGAGFTGDAYLERWQVRLGDRYILACPTLRNGDWWTRTAERLVMATMRAVTAGYHVDPDRIFLTGMSNGGIGAYLIGARYAPRFAAVIPMASGLDEVLMPFLQNFRHTPLYIIHGKQDQVMPVRLSREIVDTLTELKYSFVYREHDRLHPMAGGHFFPREELPDLVLWMEKQHRNPYPRALTVVEDASHLVPFSWVRIDATDRIASLSDNLIDQQDEAVKNRIYARADAEIQKDNRIEVRTQRIRRFTLFLNDRLVDLSRPVTVVTNGKISYDGVITRSVRTLLREARLRHDPHALYPGSITVDVPPDK
jgi:surfactin synthase thioesterase subunit